MKTGRTNVPLDPTNKGREALELEANLYKRIVGQEEAIREIVSIYHMYLAGMTVPRPPQWKPALPRPHGVGSVKNARAVIKIDCAEFQHSHEIAKLIGSPPGYLGHRETHPLLSQETLNQFDTATVKLSLILFDEIEKASDAL